MLHVVSMGWTDTVERLKKRGHIRSDRVEEAMLAIDRKEFVPDAGEEAYADRPLPIGSDQTISAPHMVAIMTEACNPQPDDRVLEIGTGSGYQAAVLSELVAEVYTVERVPELAAGAKERLSGYDNVHVYEGDGSKGLPQEEPFDTILVTAAAPRVPERLMEQLEDGGRMIVPVEGGGFAQQLKVFERRGGEMVEVEDLGSVRFVPMKGEVEE